MPDCCGIKRLHHVGDSLTLPTYNRGVGSRNVSSDWGEIPPPQNWFLHVSIWDGFYFPEWVFGTDFCPVVIWQWLNTVWGPEDKYSLLLFVTLHWQALGLKTWEWGHLQTPADKGLRSFYVIVSQFSKCFCLLSRSRKELTFSFWVSLGNWSFIIGWSNQEENVPSELELKSECWGMEGKSLQWI